MSILKSKIKVSNIILPNRLVLPPMATSKSSLDGSVTDELIKYYDEKSKGGYFGLIISEHAYVSLEGKASKGQLSISKDEDIEGLKELVNTIHKNNTLVFAQISHAGASTNSTITGLPSLSPSGLLSPTARLKDILPKKITLEEIEEIKQKFVKAAVRCIEAGFDGVEIHSAHGYFLNQFYSPLTNKRVDKYNGSTIDGRTKLHLEIIQEIRKAVGPDYPIAIRLGACDYLENGTTIQDSVEACKLFEYAGVNLLDISGGLCFYTNPNSTEQGYFKEITSAIKKEVNIPVILTGGITSALAAEQLLQNNDADLIGVGRVVLKDNEWAKREMVDID